MVCFLPLVNDYEGGAALSSLNVSNSVFDETIRVSKLATGRLSGQTNNLPESSETSKFSHSMKSSTCS